MVRKADSLQLSAGDFNAVVETAAGGRLSSLTFGDVELLWNDAAPDGERDPVMWGCYPMVPFAGRIRHGEFSFEGTDFAVPKCFGDHAMHGYGFRNPWTQVDEQRIAYDFAEPWPFTGRATQRFDISPSGLQVTMTVEAAERQPVMIGWHPWFRRENSAGTLEVDFAAESMYQRDADGIAGELVSPPVDGPLDDCFVGVQTPPVLRWGDLAVELGSSLDHWVVYDEPAHAACVEPQSGPPNEIDSIPRVLEAGESFTATFTIRVL